MPPAVPGVAHPRAWPVVVTVLATGVAGVLGGPLAALVALVVGGQAVVLSRRVPAVGPACRNLVLRWVPAAVGWLVIVVALDWGVGALWNRATGVEVEPETTDLAEVDLPPPEDPRVDELAYQGQAWVPRYFSELEALDYDYVPIIGPRLATVAGRYINSSEGIRRSYDPEGPDDLEVWFFGGSTMWGEGQRDLHTIASEVARVAEADGVRLQAVNFGERGYTAYQELLLFEQELADRGAPDLAVFYDGINELGTQTEGPPGGSVQPTIYQQENWAEAFERAPPLPGAGAPQEPSLRSEYVETSAVHKLLRRLGDLGVVRPAAAQEGPADPDQLVEQGAAIYRRSVTLIRDVAARHETPVELFWQPSTRENEQYLDMARGIPPGVHDITDAFLAVPDDDLVFIDGGHTNELGARLAAEAIWARLRPVADRLMSP